VTTALDLEEGLALLEKKTKGVRKYRSSENELEIQDWLP